MFAVCWLKTPARLLALLFFLFFRGNMQVALAQVTAEVTGVDYVDIEENAVFSCIPSGAFRELRWKKSEHNSSTDAGAILILTFLFGSPPPTYGSSVDSTHYQFDDTASNQLTVLSVTPNDTGTYWCDLTVGGQPNAKDSLSTKVTAPPGKAKQVKFEVDGMSYDPEQTIEMTAGKEGVMVTFTVYGIIPNATDVLWSVNPSLDTNLNKESFLNRPNAEDPRFGDSVSTATLDIPDAPGQLMLTCNVTYSRDGTTKSPGTAFSVTINVTATTPELNTASTTIGGPGPSATTEVSTTGSSTTMVSTSTDPLTTGSTTWTATGVTDQLNTRSTTLLVSTSTGPEASDSTPIFTSTPTPIVTTNGVDRRGSSTTPASTTEYGITSDLGSDTTKEVSTTGASTTVVSTSTDPPTPRSTTWMLSGGTDQFSTKPTMPLVTTGTGPGTSGPTPILTSTPTPILTTDDVDRGGYFGTTGTKGELASDGLTAGQIVGICVGAVALVAILLVLTLCIFCRESLSKQCSCLQCKSSVNPEKEGGTPDKEALELNGGSTSNKEKEG